MKRLHPEAGSVRRDLEVAVSNARGVYIRELRALASVLKVRRADIPALIRLYPERPQYAAVVAAKTDYDVALGKLASYVERAEGTVESRRLQIREAASRIGEERKTWLSESAMNALVSNFKKALESKAGRRAIKEAKDNWVIAGALALLLFTVIFATFPAWLAGAFVGVLTGGGLRLASVGAIDEQLTRLAQKRMSVDAAARKFRIIEGAFKVAAVAVTLIAGVSAKIGLTDFFADMGTAHAKESLVLPLDQVAPEDSRPSYRAAHPDATPSTEVAHVGAPSAEDALPTLEQIPVLRERAAAYVDWADRLIEEYRAVMDMRDPSNIAELDRLKAARDTLNAFIADIDSGKDSRLIEASIVYRKLVTAGTEPGRLAAMTQVLVDGTELPKLNGALIELDDVYQKLSLVQNGKANLSGAIQPIENLYGSEFKHVGQENLPPRTGRALIELVHDLSRDPETQRGGLRITEGGDGTNLTSEHSKRGGHYEGTAFDWNPNGPITKEYVYKVLMYGRLSNYYDVSFEPGKIFDGNELREYVVRRMVAEIPGMTEAEARAFVESNIGNNPRTTGTHFHTYASYGMSSDITPPPHHHSRSLIASV